MKKLIIIIVVLLLILLATAAVVAPRMLQSWLEIELREELAKAGLVADYARMNSSLGNGKIEIYGLTLARVETPKLRLATIEYLEIKLQLLTLLKGAPVYDYGAAWGVRSSFTTDKYGVVVFQTPPLDLEALDYKPRQVPEKFASAFGNSHTIESADDFLIKELWVFEGQLESFYKRGDQVEPFITIDNLTYQGKDLHQPMPAGELLYHFTLSGDLQNFEGEAGSLSISCQTNPFTDNPNVDGEFKLARLSLPGVLRFSPEGMAENLTDGYLNYTLNLNCREGKFTARNQFLLEDLKFAPKDRDDLLGNLLASLAGSIKSIPFEFSFEGDLSDPDFDLAGTVKKSLASFTLPIGDIFNPPPPTPKSVAEPISDAALNTRDLVNDVLEKKKRNEPIGFSDLLKGRNQSP